MFFGSSRVFVEKCIERPHHVEVQILGDKHGHVHHLFERECSIQRRNQKVLEETPSPLVDRHPGMREKLLDAAVKAAAAVGYDNAGTVEFVADDSGAVVGDALAPVARLGGTAYAFLGERPSMPRPKRPR